MPATQPSNTADMPSFEESRHVSDDVRGKYSALSFYTSLC